MSYQIKLTDAEVDTLNWAAERGYFPNEILNRMELTDEDEIIRERMNDFGTRGENYNSYQFTYNIPESAAWQIIKDREDDPHALFSCIGSPLLEKLLALENSIV